MGLSLTHIHTYTHADIKHPVGSKILEKQEQTISLEQSAKKIGKKIIAQKTRAANIKEMGPKSSENVAHVVDLCYIPKNEQQIVKDSILEGAGLTSETLTTEIIFLNDLVPTSNKN